MLNNVLKTVLFILILRCSAENAGPVISGLSSSLFQVFLSQLYLEEFLFSEVKAKLEEVNCQNMSQRGNFNMRGRKRTLNYSEAQRRKTFKVKRIYDSIMPIGESEEFSQQMENQNLIPSIWGFVAVGDGVALEFLKHEGYYESVKGWQKIIGHTRSHSQIKSLADYFEKNISLNEHTSFIISTGNFELQELRKTNNDKHFANLKTYTVQLLELLKGKEVIFLTPLETLASKVEEYVTFVKGYMVGEKDFNVIDLKGELVDGRGIPIYRLIKEEIRKIMIQKTGGEIKRGKEYCKAAPYLETTKWMDRLLPPKNKIINDEEEAIAVGEKKPSEENKKLNEENQENENMMDEEEESIRDSDYDDHDDEEFEENYQRYHNLNKRFTHYHFAALKKKDDKEKKNVFEGRKKKLSEGSKIFT